MTETDAEFVERIVKSWAGHITQIYEGDLPRLFALARRGAEMQWRPIETAPKDGTPVVLREGGAVVTAFWRPAMEWVEVNPETPTHWQPLPPPPKGESDE